MNHRTWGGILFFILMMFSPRGWGGEKSLDSYWGEIDLGFSEISQTLNNDTCTQSLKVLLACVSALDGLLFYHHPATQVVPKELLKSNQWETLQHFGSVAIAIKITSNRKPISEWRSQRIREREELRESWQQIFEQKTEVPVNRILAWARNSQAIVSKESEAVANSINSWYSVLYDPHTVALPTQFLKDRVKHPSSELGGRTANTFVRQSPTQTKYKISSATFAATTVTIDGCVEAGLLQVRSFSSKNTCFQVSTLLRTLRNQGVDGIILDLRDNPGGRISQAACVADLFLEKGEVIAIENTMKQKKERVVWKAKRTADTELPLVILVNANTASAAEMVAGALQESERALVVGERTFGKGSVQEDVGTFHEGRVTLRKTVSRFYFPSGSTPNNAGVLPNVLAYTEPNPSPEKRFRLRQNDLYLFPKDYTGEESTALPSWEYFHAVYAKADQRYDTSNPKSDYALFVAKDALQYLLFGH